MRSRLAALLIGLAFMAGAVLINLQQRALQADDIRGVAKLRAELDSVRAELGRASSVVDSTRLTRSVSERTYLLGRREFHVPSRQVAIDEWWSTRGLGSVLMLAGVLFLALAALAGRGARAA